MLQRMMMIIGSIIMIACLGMWSMGCDDGELIPDPEPAVNCEETPDDPSCTPEPVVNCEETPDDPACTPEPVIDCEETPDGPSCTPEPVIDCEETPDDPACTSEPVVDCEETPDDPACMPVEPLNSCDILDQIMPQPSNAGVMLWSDIQDGFRRMPENYTALYNGLSRILPYSSIEDDTYQVSIACNPYIVNNGHRIALKQKSLPLNGRLENPMDQWSVRVPGTEGDLISNNKVPEGRFDLVQSRGQSQEGTPMTKARTLDRLWRRGSADNNEVLAADPEPEEPAVVSEEEDSIRENRPGEPSVCQTFAIVVHGKGDIINKLAWQDDVRNLRHLPEEWQSLVDAAEEIAPEGAVLLYFMKANHGDELSVAQAVYMMVHENDVIIGTKDYVESVRSKLREYFMSYADKSCNYYNNVSRHQTINTLINVLGME